MTSTRRLSARPLTFVAVIGGTLASAAVLAQDVPDTTTMTTPAPDSPPPPEPPAPPPPAPSTSGPPPVPSPAASAPLPAAQSATGNRPTEGWSLGIGAGWVFPSDILVPNSASLRLMFPGAVTIEPFVNFSLGGTESVQEVDDPQDFADSRSDFTGSNYTTALGTAVRVPIFQRGNFDLQLLGSASASYSSSGVGGDQTFGDSAPQGVVNEQQTISVGASYGAGIEWFVLEHIAMSLDAQNPLATWSRTESRNATDVEVFDPGTGEYVQDERVTTDRTGAFNVGAIFSPTVRVMFHLYF